MKKFYLYLSLTIIFTFYTLQTYAQTREITGTVLNPDGNTIRDVLVIVDGVAATTNSAGRFSVKVDGSIDVKKIGIKKQGLRLKSIDINPEQTYLEITLQPVGVLNGTVTDGTKVKSGVSGVSVTILKTDPLMTKKTDQNGRFKFEITQNIEIDNTTQFSIDGEIIPQSNLNFMQNYAVVYIKLFEKLPEGDLKRILVLNSENKTPLKDITIEIDGKPFKANKQGEISDLTNVKTSSAVDIPGYSVEREEYDKKNATLIFYVTLPTQTKEEIAENKGNEPKIYQDQFDNINKELNKQREEQIERTKQIQREIEALTNELLQDQSITPAQRNKMMQYLAVLEKTFQENDSIFKELQENTAGQIQQLKAVISQNDSLVKANEEQIKQLEKEKTRAKRQLTTTIVVGSIIVLALAALAIIFYLIGKRMRKKNEEIRKQREALSKINAEVKEANQKMTEQYLEIQLQRDEIESYSTKVSQANQKMTEQYFEIQLQRDEIQEQKQEIEEKSKLLESSVLSAERIQNSLLVAPQDIGQHFADSFVLFKPRDIVSGDFYWYSEQEEEVILAALDCTGHGVPGAFMTVLGNSLLNQIVNQEHITDPAQILTKLDQQVQSTLRKHPNDYGGGDGMDAALLSINLKTKKMKFAGAKMPLYIFENEQLTEIKGNNITIGSALFRKKGKTFQNQELDLKGNEVLYLASDGFQDQHNPQRKKYSKRNFQQLIVQNSQKTMQMQYQILEEELKNWKKNEHQTDDILVIGVKLP